MALIVEDGTGLVNAESYISVAGADTYHSDRGNETTWTDKDDDVKEQKLRIATEYVETRFGARFKGAIEFPDTPQALSFPRSNITGYGGVPVCLKRAVAEYALRAMTTTLAPDPLTDDTGHSVAFSSKKVGPIQKKTGYFNDPAPFKEFPIVDAMLRPLLKSSAGVIR